MMAAKKEKSQDEKNLKTLREFASLSANKYCFDCLQRGPTYVDVTVGSFVCTSCSGMLRGLNPPHRVKSITMATFTSEEMEQIQTKGNEYCKQVWLGRYDSSQPVESEYQNLQTIKDFMIRKYEDKKYYVDPEFVVRKQKARAPTMPLSSSSAAAATAVPPSRSQTVFVETKTPGQFVKKSTWPDFPPCADYSSKDNLFGDAKTDPFCQNSCQTDSATENGSFADFSSAFASTSSQLNEPNVMASSSTSAAFSNSAKTNQKKPAPPPPDRYAALADLDNEFNQQQQQVMITTVPAPNMPTVWAAGNPMPPYGTVAYDASVPNPFGAHVAWPHAHMMAPAPGNPFQAMPNHVQMNMPNVSNGLLNGNDSAEQHNKQNGTSAVSGGNFWSSVVTNQPQWSATSTLQCDPFSIKSASAPIDTCNPWAQAISSESANPFTNSDRNSDIPQKSVTNNPFL